MGVMETKRVQRLYRRVAANRKNCSFEDVAGLLRALGFTSTSRGSHYTFQRRAQGEETLRITVPRARPVNSVYIDQLLKLIERIDSE
jgi:predicted RNA binding protein YcfA (HicA-like mRNA interferase family)